MAIDFTLSLSIAVGVTLGLALFYIIKTLFYLLLGAPGVEQLISLSIKDNERKLSQIEERLAELLQVVEESARNADIWP